MDEAWATFLAAMERRIGSEIVNIWFMRAVTWPESIAPGHVQICAENRVTFDWVRDNLMSSIQASWDEVQQRPVDVRLTWTGAVPEAPLPSVSPRRQGASNLISEHTFDNFVVGKCNDFAQAVSQAVADAPGVAYNPLFIYGSSGLGKTHLMHAIGNAVEKRLGGGVLYLTGQSFFDTMVSAFQNQSIAAFRQRFRTEVDVLLLDDIQIIAGRERTEEEVFHTFEVLRAANKQIVLAADQPPQELSKFAPRLRSRFSQGLLADVQPPDVETMTAILARKANELKLDVPSDALYFIAKRMRNNVREAEGVLNKLQALHIFCGLPVTLAFVQERLGNMFPAELLAPSADLILQRVAEHFHIKPSDLRAERKPANIAHPRQIAMYLCRILAQLSFPEIGRAFHRDNSTVQYACKKVATALPTHPNLQAEVELLTKAIRGTP